MKKYLILTSVLALAACGGGGHGGVSGAEQYARSGDLISDGARSSNSALTSMASAVVVAKDGSGNAVVRTAKTFGGKEYDVYTLKDVRFYIAQDPTQGWFQFDMDDEGRVASVQETLGNVSDNIQRIDNTTRFRGPMFEYVKDGGDNAKYRVLDNGNITIDDLNAVEAEEELSGGHWNRIDEVLDIKTFGRDQGLQFSDFGHFNPVYKTKNKTLTTDDQIAAARAGTLHRNDDDDKFNSDEDMEKEFNNSQDYQLFAGGYAIKNGELVDTLTPTAGMAFKGTAHGRVYSSIQTKGTFAGSRTTYLDAYGVEHDDGTDPNSALHPNKAGHDMAQNFVTNNATLTFDGTRETLTMPFAADGFYDVVITRDNLDNNTVAVQFNNGGAVPQHLRQETGEYDQEGVVKMGYYGIDNPTEAAGVVQYRTEKVLAGDTDTNDYATREWEVQAAYGMKKQ